MVKQKKLNQLMAISQVMMVATRPLTIKQIAKKASRLTGKPPMNDKAVERKLREFELEAAMKVSQTIGSNARAVARYEATLLQPVEAVTLPAVATVPNPGVPTPARKPVANPITFGLPSRNVTAAEETQTSNVAGSRSALAFIDTLQG